MEARPNACTLNNDGNSDFPSGDEGGAVAIPPPYPLQTFGSYALKGRLILVRATHWDLGPGRLFDGAPKPG